MPDIKVSDEALKYLKSLAEPFVDSPASVLDRVIEDHRKFSSPATAVTLRSAAGDTREEYRTESLPPLLHSKIERAAIDGRSIARPKWSLLVEEMIKESAKRGYSTSEIVDALEAQTWRGEKSDTGFRYVPSAGLSFQKLDANRSCRAVLGLSRSFGIPVTVDFFWRDNPKAFKPSKSARIIGP